jgi:hypothetical protein
VKEVTRSNLATTYLNIGKWLINRALLQTTILVPRGRRFGTFIPSLDTKLFFGESFKMPYLSKAPFTTGVSNATYYVLDA